MTSARTRAWRAYSASVRPPTAPSASFAARPPVEVGDARQHSPETRAHEIAPLGEEAVEAVARPAEPGALARVAERHVAVLQRHPEPLEQPREERVVAVVHHDEPGVHRGAGVGSVGDRHRVGVPAGVVAALEHRDVVMRREQPGGRQAGDAGADRRPLAPRRAGRRPLPVRRWREATRTQPSRRDRAVAIGGRCVRPSGARTGPHRVGERRERHRVLDVVLDQVPPSAGVNRWVCTQRA